MHPPGENIIAFRASITHEDDTFRGSLKSYDELSIWTTERCIPLVREITFQVTRTPLILQCYGRNTLSSDDKIFMQLSSCSSLQFFAFPQRTSNMNLTVSLSDSGW